MAEAPEKSEKLSLYVGLDKAKVDSKRRVSVPAAFRRVAEARNAHNNYEERQVLVFYDPAHKRLLVSDPATFLNKISKMSDRLGDASEILGYSAQAMSFDDQGRVLLPKDALEVLTEQPDSLKTLVFAGAMEFFEVYAPEQWEKVEAERTSKRDEFLDHLTR